ncbi:MAG: substrate-binding domain-containing protein [Chitinophagales bacterium]|nr:substrate-binding domain-containing protein [Chitinophagales bacterium]MDW8393690.1 substrate-binding domain-containing protein [Chitinophagales bacterium]
MISLNHQVLVGESRRSAQISLVMTILPGLFLLLLSCSPRVEQDRYRVGFLMETLKEERWQRDRNLFVAAAEKLGAEVDVVACNHDDNLQLAQAEAMLAKGVDLLVVVPHNGDICATIVRKAHAQGVRVIAYDRLIRNCDLDLYVSFDNERVGELQAQYVVDRLPRGNLVLIGGAKTDNNALLFRKGQLNVLQPLIDSGLYRVIMDQWATDWQPAEAMKHMENALSRTTDIQAVIASNDGTAGGAIQALAEKGLAGRVLVTGQDAELAACRRIVAGTQSMTVYKPIHRLAEAAAEAAIQILKGQVVHRATDAVPNGRIDVPSILIEPVVVDISNIRQTVIAEGFHSEHAIFD